MKLEEGKTYVDRQGYTHGPMRFDPRNMHVGLPSFRATHYDGKGMVTTYWHDDGRHLPVRCGKCELDLIAEEMPTWDANSTEPMLRQLADSLGIPFSDANEVQLSLLETDSVKRIALPPETEMQSEMRMADSNFMRAAMRLLHELADQHFGNQTIHKRKLELVQAAHDAGIMV
jgi:hypothetical protein